MVRYKKCVLGEQSGKVGKGQVIKSLVCSAKQLSLNEVYIYFFNLKKRN